ncbi:MAG: thermonuclease family protein [Alphaproteobacteria bacterium]|nr:MAG: thermonuclease family protein [Alphaproteobacteria bacterium]
MGLLHYIRVNRWADLALLALIILALLGVIRFLPEPAPTHVAGPARVIDGDSLVVEGVQIRLLGIDAPELAQICRRGNDAWACGREASRRLRKRLAGRLVECSGNRFDRHRRLLALCTADGVEINRWMVEQGWAVSFDGYRDAENAARTALRGIWGSQFQRPSAWRRERSGDP